MGRPREFDIDAAVAAATELFIAEGYEGCSMDRIVQATGVHRGSLYAVFGSKRGIFVECLRKVAATSGERKSGERSDLLLIALVELAARDDEVRSICAGTISLWRTDAARELGTRLLARAGLNEGAP
ncbi:helix-turn-helix transcriptional regulator [Arthrobacter echini]|uniref:Helix-turn-helix transcriptional regulator n=1 Tax=Arthrobacter echini TaxID=1529066 RepID=A0A4S5E9J9_9MICC|nr:helix-turn-helix domain-containing protein [Arthrobacter echini]THJ68386.1 helix-turn-helix transcriptional regulator [Arthrobacter echini]